MAQIESFFYAPQPAPGIGPVAGRPGSAEAKPAAAGDEFNAVLGTAMDEGSVRFSGHAQTRLKSRGIHLTRNDLMKIEQATDTAQAKGSRESLILMKNLGLIVNIKNRTVLTAIDSSQMKDNIVTNIDSTVIVPES